MRKIYLLFLIFLCPALYGQQYEFNVIDSGRGLNYDTIKPILRDSEGYMWFGVRTGVIRYDGNDFKSFTIDEVLEGVASVNGISEDAYGRIWVKTGKGLSVYNEEKDSLEKNSTEILESYGLPSAGEVFIDEDGNIWVIQEDTLYCHLTYQNRNVKLDGSVHIKDISSRDGHTVILSEDGSFYEADFVRDRIVKAGKTEMSDYEWHYIMLDSRSNIWFYTAHSPVDGIKCFSLPEGRWLDLPGLGEVSSTIITSVADDEAGKIWIGTEDDGIYVYDLATSRTRNIRKTSSRFNELPGNHINRVYYDNNGLIWVSFFGKGLAYTSVGEKMFKFENPGFEESILSMCEDRDGNIWLGSDGDGLACIGKDGAYSFYNKFNGRIQTDIITALYRDRKGNVWAGTFGKGVFALKDKEFVNVGFPGLSDYIAAYVGSIIEDSIGNMWFSSTSYGLIELTADGRTRTVTSSYNVHPEKSVHCLAADDDGLLLIGSEYGLFVYDCLDDKFSEIFGNNEQLRRDPVYALIVDRKGLVWIGTGGTIMVLDKNSGMLYNLNDLYGLPSTNVSSIIEDRTGAVWVATDKDLIKIVRTNQGDFTFDHCFVDRRPSIAGRQQNAAICTSDGKCITSFGNKLLTFHPEKIKKETPYEKLRFTGLYINGKQVETGDESGILKKNISLTESIQLKYNQNSIKMSLSIMNSLLERFISYKYRIPENSDEWMDVDKNEITLNQLQPGSFTLEARATDNWGWDSGTVSIKINISSPLWRSKAAIVLYLLSVMGLAFWIAYNIKNKQLLEQELAKQKEIDENKMRFITNINHDIRTPLSLVVSPLERALKSTMKDDIRQDLEISLRNAKVLSDEFCQLLDVKKLEAGSESLHLIHRDIVSYIKDTVSAVMELAGNKSIDLSFHSEEDSLYMDFDQMKVRRILLNLISNAIKYSNPGGKIRITLSKRDDETLSICVADTGTGIRDKDKSLVFTRFYQCNNDDVNTGSGIGLHIVKEYTEMHGGTVAITDNKPHGACFIITLPVRHGAGTIEEQENDKWKETPENGKINILIVEDNREFNDFLRKCLQNDYDTVAASNGREALEIMSSTEVNMVISDVMMPEMDGLELCRAIKSNIEFSHIPVILLTAKSREEDVIKGLGCGADDYLSKPFNMDILFFRIRKILEWAENVHTQISKGLNLEPSEITVSSLDEELIRRCIKSIEDNIDNENYSVEDLSKDVGMTRGHLYKKLMFITGESPIQFIRIIRIKRGKALLEQGRTNISEVAYSVGFSPKQFSKHFKDTFGCLPSEFLNGCKPRPE